MTRKLSTVMRLAMNSVVAHMATIRWNRKDLQIKKLSEWISISVGDVAVTDMQAMHYGHVKWPAAVFAGVLGGDGY